MTRAWAAALATVLTTHLVQAQPQATLDVGAASVRYTDSTRVRATTLSPSLRVDERTWSGGANGTLSLFDDAGWTAQGVLSLSTLALEHGALRVELAGDAGGSAHEDGSRTGRYLGRGRVHVARSWAGAWVGVGAGQTWDGANWRALQQGETGAWMRRGSGVLALSASPVAVADSLRYADLELFASQERGRAELTVRAGFRTGDSPATHRSSRWASLSAVFRVLPNLSLVGGAGTYPADPTQGLPGGRFAALSIRVTTARHGAVPVLDRGAETGPRLEVRRAGGDRWTIRVHARDARRVDIMGDLTSWTPVALQSLGEGWWEASVAVAPGTYQINVRLDGTGWLAPAGVPAGEDEFGVPVGILILR